VDALAQMRLNTANDHLDSLRRSSANQRLAASGRRAARQDSTLRFVRRSVGFSLVRVGLRIGGMA
jgi:uncharacterized protein YciI